MDRKQFLWKSCCGLVALAATDGIAQSSPASGTEQAKPCDPNDLTFIRNWVTDLMDTIDSEVDPRFSTALANRTPFVQGETARKC